MNDLKIAIKQPYFMPYIGFWQEVKLVDKYIFFDDVNYINRGWINRNNIMIGGERRLFTLALGNASQNKLINEITIVDDFAKLLKTIDMAYKKAPYFEQTMSLLEDVFSFEDKNLAKFVGNSVEVVSRWLGFDTEFVFSSELSNDKALRRQDKIIDICETVGAKRYYDSTGALELYDKEAFRGHGIQLQFIKSEITPYKQFNDSFVAGLSIIDVLMFNEPQAITQMLSNYELI